jgi:monofunctional glycosyltransferase
VRWTLRVVAALVVLVLLWLGWIAAHIAWYRYNPPRETAFMAQRMAEARTKSPAVRLRYTWVPYAKISPHLKRAMIAAEDAKFVEHAGFDWDGIQTALDKNERRGRVVAGGSTITQQLAKNLFLSSDRSYWRKAQELVITYMIEALWDKRRILEVYLNVVEWGDAVFGAEAAARQYFGISASQLSAEQSARLAAYLPNPKRYGRIRSGPYLDRRTAAIQRFMIDAPVP